MCFMMMLCKSFLYLFVVRYCWSFNISALTSSSEKMSKLLDEQAKQSKNTGYNVAKIKVTNEVILQLVAKGNKKEHGDEILRLMCEYTVGMNENTLDIMTLSDFRTMWRVYEDIFAFGKPPFIEHKYDLLSMRIRFQWEESGPVDYFNYIKKDALKAWNYFSEQFLNLKSRLKGF
uniref:Uncharacterized protein n=1 Tax=Graphocephala atropunctata TaxID=36148 RepID=A0A1B6KL12_9HEMI